MIHQTSTETVLAAIAAFYLATLAYGWRQSEDPKISLAVGVVVMILVLALCPDVARQHDE